MGLAVHRRKKGRPFMATSRYDVQYANGLKRVKLLTAEDAERLGDQKDVKSIKKQAALRGKTGGGD
jgi:hypothetical protein